MSHDRAEAGAPDRIALTICEAAELVGLSENAFRAHLFERCPKFYAGRAVRIPRRLFEEFVEQLARAGRVDGIRAHDLLAEAERSLENNLD